MQGFQRDETHHHDHSLTNTEIRINNKTCEFVGGQINHDHGSVIMPTHILLYIYLNSYTNSYRYHFHLRIGWIHRYRRMFLRLM